MEYKIVTLKVNTKLYKILKALKEILVLGLCTMLGFPLYFLVEFLYNIF